MLTEQSFNSGIPGLVDTSTRSASTDELNKLGKAGSREFVSSDQNVAPPMQQAKQEALGRLEEVASQRGNAFSAFGRVLGGIVLAPIVLAATVAGAAFGIVGGAIGGTLGAVAGIVASPFTDKSVASTAKAGASLGVQAGMKLARLPLEVLGYALKTPGALLSALYRACFPSDIAKLGNALLARDQPSVLNSQSGDKTVLQRLLACKPKGMSENDLKKQVLIGEQLLQAIAKENPMNKMESVKVRVDGFNDGKEYTMSSSNDTAIAISWYLTAKAAEATGETFGRGTFTTVDPDYRLTRFMANAPTCHGRISSHFASRSVSPSNLGARLAQDGLFAAFSKSSVQYGIEEFSACGKLPNGSHAILFDAMLSEDPQSKVPVPQMMLKLESFGMPTASRIFGHSDSSLDILGKLGNMVLSLDHCAQHTLNFITTRFDDHAGTGSFREHFAKDQPGELIFKPLKSGLKEALQAEAANGNKDKPLAKLLKETKDLDVFLHRAQSDLEFQTLITQNLKGDVTLEQMIESAKVIKTQRGEASYQGVVVNTRQGGEVILDVGLDSLKKKMA